MNHLLIGAAQAAHNREYARSWELATSVRPRIWGWAELASGHLPELPPGPLLVRFGSPTTEEIGALGLLGGALPGAPDVEAAPAALDGLLRAVRTLDQHLVGQRVLPRYATPPQGLATLLDLELRHRTLERDRVPVPNQWPLAVRSAHQVYEALRQQLRQSPGGRLALRLQRCLGPVPTVLLWTGGRGLRAQANCRFTPLGATRCPVHPIDDEAELRPLLGRLLELGAVIEEDWVGAEIAGRPFVLSLLCTSTRLVLGQVGPGGAWRPRGAPPEPGVPRDFVTLRRQIPRELWERIEKACVGVCRVHRCAGLVMDVALSRRYDDFRVLDLDPFAELPGDRRDAVGWSAYDHLVRRIRTLPELPEEEALPATP